MVSLTLATDTPLVVNGVECQGPCEIVGEAITVLGQTLDSGVWLVGLDAGSPALVQMASWHPSLVTITFPLCLAAGMLAALLGFRLIR